MRVHSRDKDGGPPKTFPLARAGLFLLRFLLIAVFALITFLGFFYRTVPVPEKEKAPAPGAGAPIPAPTPAPPPRR